MGDLLNKQKEGCAKKLVWPLLIITIVLFLYFGFILPNNLKDNRVYSYGVIYKRLTASAQNNVLYRYNFEYKKYIGAERYLKEFYNENAKYLVELSENDPDNSNILYYMRLHDTVSWVPYHGWDTIPINLLHQTVTQKNIELYRKRDLDD